MPEYSTTTITPSGSVKVPAMNGATPGNFDLDALKAFVNTGMMPEYDTDDSVWDTAPTSGSVNAVTSGGVHTAIANETADRLLHQTVTDRRLDNLEQIAGEYVQTDLQDYSIVPTGKATYALVETMKGVSRVENQICPKFTAQTAVVGDVTWTIDADGVVSATWSTTLSANSTFAIFGSTETWGASIAGGHSVLAGIKPSGTSTQIRYAFYDSNGNTLLDSGVTDDSCANIFSMPSGNTATNLYYALRIVSGTPAGSAVFHPIFTDLTTYFNGNIPTNAQTIEGIQQYYPELLEPRAYNAGEIVDSTYTKVESRGVNIWDEVWSAKEVDASTGQQTTASSNRISSDNLVPVYGGEVIYAISSDDLVIYAFDGSGNYLGYANKTSHTFGTANFEKGTAYTVPSGVVGLRFMTYANYGSTYKNDTQFSMVNGSVSTANTTYHPYMTATRPIPSVTLKGAGSVHDELDVESGEIARRIGSVDLGTLSWNKHTSGNFFAQVSAMVKFPSAGYANILCAEYSLTSTGAVSSHQDMDKVIFGNSNDNYVVIRDSAYLNNTAYEFKSAMSGKILYYELATPTTDSVTPTLDNTLKTEGGGTVYTDADVDGQFTLGFINL